MFSFRIIGRCYKVSIFETQLTIWTFEIPKLQRIKKMRFVHKEAVGLKISGTNPWLTEELKDERLTREAEIFCHKSK